MTVVFRVESFSAAALAVVETWTNYIFFHLHDMTLSIQDDLIHIL